MLLQPARHAHVAGGLLAPARPGFVWLGRWLGCLPRLGVGTKALSNGDRLRRRSTDVAAAGRPQHVAVANSRRTRAAAASDAAAATLHAAILRTQHAAAKFDLRLAGRAW